MEIFVMNSLTTTAMCFPTARHRTSARNNLRHESRMNPRIAQIVARLRRRQLESAIAGRIDDSARYAHRVRKLMRMAC